MNNSSNKPDDKHEISTWLPALEVNDLDQRIWKEELDGFVPRRVFDVHTHIYRWEHNTDPDKDTSYFSQIVGERFPESTVATLDFCDAKLMSDREVHRLAFGYPFLSSNDFSVANRFVADEIGRDSQSRALMLVHPSMTPEQIEAQLIECGFLGFKPYRLYSTTGDINECRITDYLPENQIELANKHNLIVMLHLSKQRAIADPENIEDLECLCEKYPNVKWILAHCARCYFAGAIDKVAKRLRNLSNVWFDTSSVCESDAIEALIAGVGPERVMYGSDDLPVGITRGKFITFGCSWANMCESNHSFDLSHCDGRMTFVRYEQLRAMRRAAIRLGLNQQQIEDLFYNTALNLVGSATSSLPNQLG
jgi:glutamate-1-semialdehyde 2,1-aminomutase